MSAIILLIRNIIRILTYYKRVRRWADFFHRAKGGIPQIWAALSMRPEFKDMVMAGERLSKCEACPIFDPQLRTCGNPLNPAHYYRNEGQDHPMGCWCQMDLKATNPEATCWADEHGMDEFGWKEL